MTCPASYTLQEKGLPFTGCSQYDTIIWWSPTKKTSPFIESHRCTKKIKALINIMSICLLGETIHNMLQRRTLRDQERLTVSFLHWPLTMKPKNQNQNHLHSRTNFLSRLQVPFKQKDHLILSWQQTQSKTLTFDHLGSSIYTFYGYISTSNSKLSNFYTKCSLDNKLTTVSIKIQFDLDLWPHDLKINTDYHLSKGSPCNNTCQQTDLMQLWKLTFVLFFTV